MGAQDSFPFAQDFQESTGTLSFPMFWDQGFTSWSYYGVSGQPTAILVDATGTPISGWRGAFPEEEVLELAANA
jgi:hypothetical protein